MNPRYDPKNWPTVPQWVEESARRDPLTDPRGYLPDDGLVAAVNVALVLGLPLLVTGEPGCGKSQLAYAVAGMLDWGPPLTYEVKSTTTAMDLFYQFDAMGEYRDVHRLQAGIKDKDEVNAMGYVHFNALGKAILKAGGQRVLRERGYAHPQLPDPGSPPGPSVVLLDEVDKAPRDMPNDLLRELEELFFRIPQLGESFKVAADPACKPLVILTSNSEKSLPDAFLRRCIYYHIPSPQGEALAAILAGRLRDYPQGSPLLTSALDLFKRLRTRQRVRKPPSIAEFLNWLSYLKHCGMTPGANLAKDLPQETLQASLATLLKSQEDRQAMDNIIGEWRAGAK